LFTRTEGAWLIAAQIGSILSKEGVRGMYAGYGSFLLRDLPFDAIEFFAYEQLKHGAYPPPPFSL
jgi:hypothetical protein